tara:strand:+ start:2268 stop:2780 length:513 start_codon:yes stop_codon:yes gene_type:complete
MDINYILLDLEIIKQIKENDKLGLIVLPGTKKLFVDTSTTLSGLRRWYNGNNREDTINYIEDLFIKVEKISNLLINGKHKNLSKTLKKSLTESIKGLENLKKTYETDSITVAKLILIINKLNIIIKLLNLPIEENEILNNLSNELIDDINNNGLYGNEFTANFDSNLDIN